MGHASACVANFAIGSLCFLPFAGGRPLPAIDCPEPLSPLGSGPFSLSPDGRYLLCVRVDPSNIDVTRVEGFDASRRAASAGAAPSCPGANWPSSTEPSAAMIAQRLKKQSPLARTVMVTNCAAYGEVSYEIVGASVSMIDRAAARR